MKMLQRIGLVVLALCVLGTVVTHADDPSIYYCKTGYEGPEKGTKAQPYDTCDEAKWVAIGSNLGGYVCAWAEDDYQDWTKAACTWYGGCHPGSNGVPFAQPLLWIGLVLLALLLLGTGLLLRRRLGGRGLAGRA